VISVDDFDELVESVALMQSVRHRPRGRGLGIINVSGGEIALTCDMAQSLGIELPELSQTAVKQLQAALPSFGHATNPVDATGSAVLDTAMYQACIEALASDPAIALVAVSQDCPSDLGPRQAARYSKLAATAAEVAKKIDKPLVFYSNLAAGIHPLIAEPLDAAGVPALQGARASLLAIRRLFEYGAGLSPVKASVPLRGQSTWRDRLRGGQAFTEREAKAFLAEHGVAVTREAFAANADEAAAAAQRLGFPVVLKIESADILHKSDVGGVRLDLQSGDEVRVAFREVMANARIQAPQAGIKGVAIQEMVSGGIELIIGISRQEPFGMAMTVGLGGILVEFVRDSALALLPIDRGGAMELISRTQAAKLLEGYRGAAPSDTTALVELMLALSGIATAYTDEIEVLELNPVSVLAAGAGVRVLDALLIPRKPIAEH
jgi:acyl-CoA synthetase (NDP forming)